MARAALSSEREQTVRFSLAALRWVAVVVRVVGCQPPLSADERRPACLELERALLPKGRAASGELLERLGLGSAEDLFSATRELREAVRAELLPWALRAE